MSAFKDHILRVGLILAAFAIGATTFVVLTENSTRDKIAANERDALLKALNAVVPSERYDNDILSDMIVIAANQALGTQTETTVYRARKNNNDAAVVLSAIAPNGYNGKISLLVGIFADGSVSGVRVISHKETPGLGDKIDIKKSDWILDFNGSSLSNPVESQWKVKKDGGQFDQFTGATITPRAIVTAVKNALLYFNDNRDALFAITESSK
jgi:electron transport complex protein RnfG